MINKRTCGADYERVASEYLQAQGLEILERNYRVRYGEIDLIARDGMYLVFVEVKYRKNTAYGFPEEAVTPHKQHVIRKVAEYYIQSKHQINSFIRFDVISILDQKITWIRNAF